MVELLAELSRLIVRLQGRAFFQPPASAKEIADAEAVMGLSLPEAYRMFLRLHDGGFISPDPVDEADERAFADGCWNSHHLRGCADLVREYQDAFLREKDIDPDLEEWPYIPFCHTDGQEVLVFGPRGPNGIEPVLDAWHDVGPAEWGVLADSFADFLRTYVDSEGFPPTIGLMKG